MEQGITLQFSTHALLRMQQRRLSIADVEYVAQYGRHYHHAGVIHCFLGRNNIPARDAKRYMRLAGAVVILSTDDLRLVITVYRNQQALKAIRCKARYNLRALPDPTHLPISHILTTGY